jgi:hypothetical protein
MPLAITAAAALVLAVPPAALPAPSAPVGATARITIEPRTARIGDVLTATIEVEAPAGVELEPESVGPELGPFRVIEGVWSSPIAASGGPTRSTWSGKLAAYELGALELPGVRLRARGADGAELAVETEPQTVQIVSVLDGGAAAGSSELADLKPPAALPPDWRPLGVALGVTAGLLALSGVLWWLHRRYAARLAAVPPPEDPFHRVPAHVWVYSELQKLLERRLAERHQVALFFEELARIVKRYLGGRYRLDLMEATTPEVPDRLAQAGAPQIGIELTAELLERCDLVKFAREDAGPDACRASIEHAYRIVDVTKPIEATPAREEGAA